MALDHNSSEYHAFLKAVKKGQLEEVEPHLVKHPEFLDLADPDGNTPLHWAAGYGCDSIVELLFQHGSIAFNSPDYHGLTPLYWAAWHNRDSMVKILKAIGGTNLSLKAIGGTNLSLNQLNLIQVETLQASIPEKEILEIRFRIYFTRSLTSQLLQKILEFQDF